MKQPSFLRITSRASRSREDQLTEVAALVFKVAPALAQLFVAEIVGGNRTGQPLSPAAEDHVWDVGTQLSYESERAGRPDLILSSATHRFWVEAKLDSGPGYGQLAKYYAALKKECEQEGIEGALIYLTRQGASTAPVDALMEELKKQGLPGPGDPAICEYDWTKLEREMRRIAKKQPGSSQAKLADEFAIYLEESGAMVPPLDKDKSVSLVSDFKDVRAGLWDLLEGVAGRIYAAFDERKEDHKRPKALDNWPGFPRYYACYEIEGSEEVLGSTLLLEWNFDDRDEWLGRKGPAFAWGLTLNSDVGQWPEDSQGLVDRLVDQDFLTLPDEGYPRLFRHEFLEDILDLEALTEDRAKALSEHVVQGLKVARREAESWIAENR